MNKIKILGVCGSRSLSDERVKIILYEAIEKYQPETIVTHAEPTGVCEIAQLICKEKGIGLKLHFLNFKYLRGAFEHRSKAVLKDCDYCIFIHDGNSKGTANEYKLAQKIKMPCDYITLKPAKYPRSVGFDVTTDWDINIEGW